MCKCNCCNNCNGEHTDTEQVFKNGFNAGAEAGSRDIMNAFVAASTVTKVVFKDDTMTIVEFLDGDHVIVEHKPEYGYVYDPEKAIMAAMLKHLVGSAYISVLKKFIYRGEAVVVNSPAFDKFVKPVVVEVLPFDMEEDEDRDEDRDAFFDALAAMDKDIFSSDS